MERYAKRREDITCMVKLTEKRADNNVTGAIDNFIYFSPVNSSHGSRIKFYGGTKDTASTRTAPSYGFSDLGATEAIPAPWMNAKNCPNAFDQDYLDRIARFIDSHIAVLELVWHNHLDEIDALEYFHGTDSFDELLCNIDYHEKVDGFDRIKSEQELHEFCLEHGLYRF